MISHQVLTGTTFIKLRKNQPKTKSIHRFREFLCHTKYNDRRENLLNILSKNDEDAVHTTDASRSSARKSTKNEKDKIRAINSGDSKLFHSRGFTMDSRIQMIKIAQFNYSQKMEAVNHTLQHLTDHNKAITR